MADLAALVDKHAPVVDLPAHGIYTGAVELDDGRRVKRSTFVCGDLAREACDLLGVDDPTTRSRVLAAVVRRAWTNSRWTANGRERRWFTTEEMVTTIEEAAGVRTG